MYRVTRMQVAETFCHVQQLRMASVPVKSESGQGAHQSDPIRARIVLDVMS